jgi:hypothetical protein
MLSRTLKRNKRRPCPYPSPAGSGWQETKLLIPPAQKTYSLLLEREEILNAVRQLLSLTLPAGESEGVSDGRVEHDFGSG